MTFSVDIEQNLAGLGIILISFILILFYTLFLRKRDWRSITTSRLRNITGYSMLKRSLSLAVESGKSVHLSIGWGAVTGLYSTSSIIALTMLRWVFQKTSPADKQGAATSGDGTLHILAKDSINSTHIAGSTGDKDPTPNVSMSGATPLSYAGGTITEIKEDKHTANILVGHFGPEAAYMADAGENEEILTIAGSDNISAQAVLYTTVQEPLIGEELYAGGAYTESGVTHTASIFTQDVLRWLLVIIILSGVLLNLAGVI